MRPKIITQAPCVMSLYQGLFVIEAIPCVLDARLKFFTALTLAHHEGQGHGFAITEPCEPLSGVAKLALEFLD